MYGNKTNIGVYKTIWKDIFRNTMREVLFRLFCHHAQSEKPNILLFCTRRSGLTWLLNTMAAHPGMRYVGRPFDTLHRSRWRYHLPKPSGFKTSFNKFDQRIFIHYEAKEERKFHDLAESIIFAKKHIYPTLNYKMPYFQRKTDRVVFQLTNVTAMIEYFSQNFKCDIGILIRHPISNAISVINMGWPPECNWFLDNEYFVDAHLSPYQVDIARQIMKNGSEIEQHVLDWTLKMMVPIQAWNSGIHEDWLMLSYEQIIYNPDLVLESISKCFDLPYIDSMRAQIKNPSRTVTRSTVFHIENQNINYLLGKWKKIVNEKEEKELLQIPYEFGIEAYQYGKLLPRQPYLLGRCS
jgi:hypothetical protein